MITFAKILWWFVYALPAVLFFSYHPVIKLGANESMNFELSLPLIWLLFFDLGAFILLLMLGWRRHRTKLSFAQLSGISDRRFFLLALFPLYLTLSAFWSANPLRGLLTAGVLWLVFFAIFAMLYILPLAGQPRHLRARVLSVMFIATVAVCIFCYVQSIMDILGSSRDATLLCPGCTYRSFGFPHPSGFAIEPQFMGNLLLAPTLTAIYLIALRSQKITRSALLTSLAVFLSTTLFFTFSRGAIYAYGVAIIVLLIIALRRHVFRWSLITIPIISFLLSLGLQGTFAAVGPTSETFISGVTKSIHQLSLGIIDLRPQDPTPPPVENSLDSVQNPSDSVDNAIETVDNPSENVENPTTNSGKPPEDTIFEGYVPESTNIRLSLNQTAINTWLQNPVRIIFGVGLGGAGTAMHAAYPDKVTSPKEIVQHQGFSLLLETGLLGVMLCIFGLLVALTPQLFSPKFLDGRSSSAPATVSAASTTTSISPVLLWRHPAAPLLIALIAAYLITLNFFSGLPNALQIYLMPPLLYLTFLNPSPASHQITKQKGRDHSRSLCKGIPS